MPYSANPQFTSHERTLLRQTWGSRTTHLTRTSFLPLGSCNLCLLAPARPPIVACRARGDVFCRECALSDLLAQSAAREKAETDHRREEERLAAERERGRRAEEVRSLEKWEAGNWGRNGSALGGKRKRREDGEVSFWVPGRSEKIGSERKAANAAAAKGSAEEVPAGKKRKVDPPRCPGSTAEAPHGFSLKTLITVHFSGGTGSSRSSSSTSEITKPLSSDGRSLTTPQEMKDEPPARSPEEGIFTCPACTRPLTNASKPIMAIRCGHVLCRTCADQFLRPHKEDGLERKNHPVQCYVCSLSLVPPAAIEEGKEGKKRRREKEKAKKEDADDETSRTGLLLLNCEGTGFAAGGRTLVKKYGEAFQC